MDRAYLALTALSLIALVAASGCVYPENEAIEMVKGNPAAADFLAENVRAQPTVAIWTQAESQNRIDYLVEKCGPQINPTDYYYVVFQEGSNMLEAWVYQEAMVVACVSRSDDECAVGPDCEDGDLCTVEECSGIPKECLTTRISQCMGGDNCCPSGCTYTIDYDCPRGECVVHSDCDDSNPSTEDICSGDPKRCSNVEITECRDGDGYCPAGCVFAEDKDCPLPIVTCTSDEYCNDNDNSTRETCDMESGLCVYELITECKPHDSYCPPGCDRTTDGDCFAGVGDKERVIVTCQGTENGISQPLQKTQGGLTASFNETVNNSKNAGLQFYAHRTYKYNYVSTGYSQMSEVLSFSGRSVYDNETTDSTFSFNLRGVSYELSMPNGIPATSIDGGQHPFVSGNDDKIMVPLFGRDAFVVSVNQDEKQVQVVTDATELTVGTGQSARVEERSGKSHSVKISTCTEESAAFVLYEGDKVIGNQTAATGDVLFPGLLERTAYLSYLHFDSGTSLCDFRYVNGASLEIIVDGDNFTSEMSSWVASLSFEDNRLRKIALTNNEISYGDPLARDESTYILSEGTGTGAAEGFCSIRFAGLLR